MSLELFLLADVEQVLVHSTSWSCNRVPTVWSRWRRISWHQQGLYCKHELLILDLVDIISQLFPCLVSHFPYSQLDGLIKSLGFTQKKADSQVRWAVLNTVLLLRRHERARSQLAEAMSSGKSVGTCIEVIEGNINTDDIWCGCH